MIAPAAALVSVLLAVLLSSSVAHPEFQQRIPNGANVPNPCNRSTLWPGVGHKNRLGAGPRNPFGLDFKANELVWNRTLCLKDSDGDGRTNGQELGDPNCTWTPGSTPKFTTNLSHPGVCEPVGSKNCLSKNSWFTSCNTTAFNCSAINDPDVKNFTLRFPVTPIPAKATTYICKHFVLPNDSVSDIIAVEPVIDNAAILHHMLIFACNGEPSDSPTASSYECGMGGGMSCPSMIGGWTVGLQGVCYNSQLGFRIGPGGFQYAIVQLHWNNPQLKAGLTDSSGLKFYRTTHLRPNRGQVAMVGQLYLDIPPRQPRVTYLGSCSPLCTTKMPHSIFLTSALLHMHMLGRSGEIRLNRNGTLIKVLGNVTQYDYNAPTMNVFDTPIEMKPGDEIKVRCVYSSLAANSTTYFGEGTNDEMCFGFFAYYPLIDYFGMCGQWKGVDVCNDKYEAEFPMCHFNDFIKLIVSVPYVCNGTKNCTSRACGSIMDGIQATACLRYQDVIGFVYGFMPTYYAAYAQCSAERSQITTKQPSDDDDCDVSDGPPVA